MLQLKTKNKNNQTINTPWLFTTEVYLLFVGSSSGVALLPALLTPGSQPLRQPFLGPYGLLRSSYPFFSQPEARHLSKSDLSGVGIYHPSIERQHVFCTQSHFTKVYNLGYSHLLLPLLESTLKFYLDIRPDRKSRIL